MNRQQLAYCFFLALLLTIANNQSVFGQGKLARVRDAVRHSEPSKPARKDSNNENRDRKKDRRRDSDRDHRSHRQPNRRPQKNRGRAPRRNAGLNFRIGPSLAPAIREVHVVHHAPQPVVAQPVYIDPVPSQVPVYESVVTPVIEPQPTPEADYFAQSASSFDWGIRSSAVGGTDFEDIAFGRFDLLLQIPNGPGIDTSVTMIRESGMSFRECKFNC